MREKTCAICDLPFTEKEWEDRHSPHDDGCPNCLENYDGSTYHCDCSCSDVHAECCPECQDDADADEKIGLAQNLICDLALGTQKLTKDRVLFKKIEDGICPDCNGTLTDDTGYCAECHVIPALDPEYQRSMQFLNNQKYKITELER
jgi:hypothetical protein